jgi:hypothetical protein
MYKRKFSEREKTCSKCGETRSIEEFNWAKKSEEKRHARCRDCLKSYVRDIDLRDEPRVCSKCKTMKDAVSFPFVKKEIKKRNPWCKLCCQEKNNQPHYYERNNKFAGGVYRKPGTKIIR